MGKATTPKRVNRTITVDFQNEAMALIMVSATLAP